MKQGDKPKMGGFGWWCSQCNKWVNKGDVRETKGVTGRVGNRYHDAERGGCGLWVQRRKRKS